MVLAVVFAFARVVFGVKIEGSIAGFIAVCTAFGLMTATYGLLIAAVGRTPQAARGLSILATLFMVMLERRMGAQLSLPRLAPASEQTVPARWAMEGSTA